MSTTTLLTPAASTILPYTHGLTGVNLRGDEEITYYLWFSLGALCLVILLVRLMQRGNAHLRHLFCLEASASQQKYWSEDQSSFWPRLKKDLLYAPIHKKRHNREIQLSRAINVGTIPSRLHSLLLGLYLLSNVAYCCLLDYRQKNRAALLAEVRGRTGHLAVVNMMPLIVLAGRNNPLISLLRVSFDTYNLFHRWIGRIVVLESIAHTIAWAVNMHAAEGFKGLTSAFHNNTFLQYGLLSTGALSLILIQSPSAIRHAFYETFLHLHQLLAFLALLGIYIHAVRGSLPQLHFIEAVILFWIIDRSIRCLRLIYRNTSRHGLTTLSVEALPGDACRLTFTMPRPWTFRPGCHAYVYIPSLSLWMSHPFSVAWSEQRPVPYRSLESEKLPTSTSDLGSPLPNRTVTSMSLVVSKRSGMTARLHARASASPTGIISLTGFLEGPYGGLESLASYGTVLLFAGGVGITHQLPHVRHLLAAHANRTAAVRSLTLVWSVRTTEQLEWVRPWMDQILAMPGRREVLKVLLFVTKPRCAREVRSPSQMVQMWPGRADARVLVQRGFRERVGAMAVGVCGPGGLRMMLGGL
ncbi:MAG: FRE ferric reductase-like transmembrane component [Lasallia pustulata]|uniref:ferric-chelate reductase (NADPH) n=1 Tax=Lasallia pustulata TaxID=136370 RepID=A0A5M8PRK2_9LECA|nr:MAG: FRE ferric reductase-like transmembrane component [Lasallia pustulata]